MVYLPPRPIVRRTARKHPRLTRNRHVNEHLTFCAMHTKAAQKRTCSARAREKHREAALIHMLQAAHHYRAMR